MALGPRDLSTLTTFTGYDADELLKYALADGTTIDIVDAQLRAGLGAVNVKFQSGLWGDLCYFTDEPRVDYRMGSTNSMERSTEYGLPDDYRATVEGHMLPILDWDRGLAWTYKYLKQARLSDISADIADGLKAVEDRWRVSIFTRLLQRGDDSGANKGLGSSGYSPGFATTAGSTNVDFTPPSFGGNTFASTHEHYVAIAGGVPTVAMFQDAYSELREHGHTPPFDFLASDSDRVAITNLNGFTPNLANTNSDVIQAITLNQVNLPAEYIGEIESFRVRTDYGIPQYYACAFKTYGVNSPRNPVAIRLFKGTTLPTAIASTHPNVGSMMHPLQSLMLFFEFGVGINDRTAATPRYFNNNTWSDGTPT